MLKTTNRRKFFRDTAFSTAGIMLGRKMSGSNLAELILKDNSTSASFNIMKEVMRYRKIDAHEHVGLWGITIEDRIDFADRLYIEKLSVSMPITGEKGSPEEVRRCNDVVINAVKSHPDRVIGFFTLIPTFAKESLEEIKRCVDEGMSGYKGYLQVKVNDPSYYPIIEKLIDLKMICFMHACSALGRGGYRTKYGNLYPNESTADDFVDAAKRYPEAMFQYAHTGGGGDWEYACKAMNDFPNIYVDISGSNNEGNMIDFALKYLGEDRLFFGTDMSFYQGVGAILASNLNDAQKKKIFFENFNNVLRKSGKNVD